MALTTYTATITASGTAHTKGGYTQIVASTPYTSSRLHLNLALSMAATRFLLFDLATGAAGAETVICANLPLVGDVDWIASSVVAVDVDIPAGTRLAVRCQAATGGTQMFLQVWLENRALGALANPVTYGADTAGTRGTQVDPGGIANTKSAYVTLSASTTARIDALALFWMTDFQGSAISQTQTWDIDIATGAAGAETVILPDMYAFASAATDAAMPRVMRFPVSIPAGSRLAVRAACNFNTATQRLLRVIAVGMQEPASASSGPTAVAYVG